MFFEFVTITYTIWIYNFTIFQVFGYTILHVFVSDDNEFKYLAKFS